MRLSHTLLLVSMLSFGGFMVSKLVHAMVTPTSGLREIPEHASPPKLLQKSVVAPAVVPSEPSEQVPSCPLPEASKERNASAGSTEKRPSQTTGTPKKPSTCCCDVKRKRLHLI